MRVVIVYCTREFCNLLRWNYDRLGYDLGAEILISAKSLLRNRHVVGNPGPQPIRGSAFPKIVPKSVGGHVVVGSLPARPGYYRDTPVTETT